MSLSMTRRQFVGKSVQGAAIAAAGKFFVAGFFGRDRWWRPNRHGLSSDFF